MIHFLNNLPNKYDVMFARGKWCNVRWTCEPPQCKGWWCIGHRVIHEKLNHLYKEIKKNKEKGEKEKALGAYNKQYKQVCNKWGKYGHNSGNQKCAENEMEQNNDNKTEKNDCKKKCFDGNCYHCGKRGHKSEYCYAKKNKEKRNEKAENAVDGSDNDELALCSLMSENKKEEVK